MKRSFRFFKSHDGKLGIATWLQVGWNEFTEQDIYILPDDAATLHEIISDVLADEALGLAKWWGWEEMPRSTYRAQGTVTGRLPTKSPEITLDDLGDLEL